MKKKLFNAYIWVVVAMLALSCVLSACNQSATTHQHKYSEYYSKSETHHWKNSTCGCDVVFDYGEHVFNQEGECIKCRYQQGQSHVHTWSNQWATDENCHWRFPLCDDTTEVIDQAQHVMVNKVCEVCGYRQSSPETPHTHSWSNQWSSNYTYHWRNPLCSDTDEIQDKSEHNFVNYVCSECGYNRMSDPRHLPQTNFKDVGKKFATVYAPLREVTERIVRDKFGESILGGERNTRIIGVRYYYGRSFEIILRQDVFIAVGETSEFLQLETGIVLEDFGEHYDKSFVAYQDFLRAERKSQSLDNYEEFILPYAQRSADMIWEQYNVSKNAQKIHLSTYGKQLVLSADSSLSEHYAKIVDNLNGTLTKRGYPVITNQNLNISFGGNIYWEVVNRWIIIQVNVNSLQYRFYISFNEDGEFSEEFLNYYQGTVITGYVSNPDQYNPKNEEYAQLFEQVKIEEIDLSDIGESYKYDGEGSALYAPDGENTYLYFN